VFIEVEEIRREIRVMDGLAEGPREPSIKKPVEQDIVVIEFDIVAQVRSFIHTANEVYYQLATFGNNDKSGLIELLKMKVASKNEEVSWILVKRRLLEVCVEVIRV
jgi:hypothetical protein